MKCISLSAILASAVLLGGCEQEAREPILHTVAIASKSVRVPAAGEVEAAEMTVITVPAAGDGQKYVAWLAPEFTQVKEGDVIARFDGEMMMKARLDETGKLAIAEQELLEKNAELGVEFRGIELDKYQTGEEKTFTEQFSVQDETIRSRLEILEELENIEFLDTKLDHLDWKEQRFGSEATGELDVLRMKQEMYRDKVVRLDEDLSGLEIRAPHDGMLTYQRNWRGEKPRVGSSLWRGHKIASLPDLSVLQAKLAVLEKDALGLAPGQEVSLWLEVAQEQKFKGTVKEVSGSPASRERGNPQKYYDVTVSIEKPYPAGVKIGSRILAEIIASPESEKLSIPLQSVFYEEEKPFVYLYADGSFQKRVVEPGKPSLTHVEILSGLQGGERIALFDVAPERDGAMY
ncbi:efflux RND transporter periplasmic adaptor subunit [Biformimicrobium ophioploci]|uniref:Uncharacterized protein n=1 Tax=Biformimicrobium ophioploci TaxID=3036711 RepID=A0ABQ6LYE3_9GAMM|nr:efflux RND transporter periplasmic adaptor subunit [Microbulbifer sp. NKW57]GMG87065.1 hypothetical protein MNKW57_13860 [Microbulbifer sp. NKW57]